MPMLRPAVFIDRDGTINQEVGYLDHVARFSLLPNTITGLVTLQRNGWLVVVITNQAGVAKGYLDEKVLAQIHAHMRLDLVAHGIDLPHIYVCPHAAEAGCDCRKPAPGLLLRAADDLAIDLSGSYLIGDKMSDLKSIWAVGGRGVLVKTGYGLGEVTHRRAGWRRKPDIIAEDLFDAAIRIGPCKTARAQPVEVEYG